MLSQAQSWDPGKYVYFRGVSADSVLRLPRIDTVWLGGNRDSIGAIVYRTANNKVYVKKPTGWDEIASGINVALDSAYRSHDTLYFPTTTGSLIAIKMTGIPQANIVGLTDSLNQKISFSSPLSPLMTQPSLPIQPTSSLIGALGRLQSQVLDRVELNPVSTQQGASVNITGRMLINGLASRSLAINRPSRDTSTGEIAFQTAGIQVGYVGTGAKGNNDILMTSGAGGISINHVDSAQIRLNYFSNVPGVIPATHTVEKNGLWLIGDSIPGNVFARFPLEVRKTLDTSIYANGKIVQGQTILNADSSLVTATTAWVKRQLYFNTSNASLQGITQRGNTTNQILKITGSSGTLTGTGSGLELFYDGSNFSVVQSYDRGMSITKPLKLSASYTQLSSGIVVAQRTVTASTTLLPSDYTVIVNNVGSVTITLPSSTPGTMFVITKTSAASNDVIVSPSSGTINGVSSRTLTMPYSSIVVQSTGTNWIIISSHLNSVTL